MTTHGGGEIAAYGLSYQYMATADHILRYLHSNPEAIPRATLIVEPLLPKADGKDDDEEDDIVDFAIEIDDEAADSAQVKSSLDPLENPLQPAPARIILERLLGNTQAPNLLILTNRPLSPQLAEEAEVESIEDSRTTFRWAKGPQPRTGEEHRCPRIIVDSRTPAELRDSIAGLVRKFRKDRDLSQGLTSSLLLVPILLDYIFQAAAGNAPNYVPALDLLEKLAMPDARIAHVAGAFDWGLPISGIPNYESTVPRLELLDDIQEHITTDDTATQPARVVLTGLTGSGKSVIASDYCHVSSVAYEFMCWIDCREVDFIDPQVRNIVSQLTRDEIAPTEAIGSVFTGLVGRHRGPWLIVFDGIQNREDIETYVPSMGRGSVLVTTNNSLHWWPTAHMIEIGDFTEQEAIDCFCSYAAIPTGAVEEFRGPISDIVNRIGRVPLAVSMTGIYFANTQGQLSELAAQYVSALEALSDAYAIPSGFHKTAFVAINYAVRSLGKGTPSGDIYGRRARAVMHIGSLLAPELVPLNFILPATADSVQADLANLPRPTEADPVLRRGVLSILRTQTIAHRVVVNDDGGKTTLVSDTVAIHQLVHDILRESYLAEVPPGQLQAQAMTLMYYLVGWIGALRSAGEYFAVEQLRLHAESLLKLVNDREPLPSLSPQAARVYTYAKALLQAELSTCQASRGNLQDAYDLGRAAAQNLSKFAHEQAARVITVKILARMIKDLALAESPPELLAIFSTAVMPAVLEAETDSRSSVRDFAYDAAGDLFFSLSRTETYRNSSALIGIREQLEEIEARDPTPAGREATQLRLINQLYESKDFQQMLDFLPEWRASGDSLEGTVIVDGIEIVAQLHTDAVDEALQGVDRLLDVKTYGNYLSMSLIESLGKVARELNKVAAMLEEDRPRLEEARDKVMSRWTELTSGA
jgi:hypothetical protein